MAQKFFNKNIKRRNKSFLPIIIIIVGTLLIVLIIVMILNSSKNKMPKNAVVIIRDSVQVGLNGTYPEKTTYFAELKNVSQSEIEIEYENADLTKPGEYTVNIRVYDKKYTSKLVVIDNIAPILKVKNYAIKDGELYQPADFVESCVDNSGNECIYEFYTNAIDSKGNLVDFSSYTKKGNYVIMIVARDIYGNVTQPLEAELTISSTGTFDPEPVPTCDNPPCEEEPSECLFGNNTLANGNNISVDVSQNGCAIDTELYQDQSLLKRANELIENEKAKLVEEFKKYDLNVKDVYINAVINPVLNGAGSGLVGYLINIEVFIMKNNEKEVIENYFITETGSRAFSINNYNLSN